MTYSVDKQQNFLNLILKSNVELAFSLKSYDMII
jgi:hypothetical protein